jgi:hypothetical protein
MVLKINHNKYLLIIWIFITFLMRNFYTSNIQAMNVSKKELRIETFEQLIQNKNIKILVDNDSYAYRILAKV